MKKKLRDLQLHCIQAPLPPLKFMSSITYMQGTKQVLANKDASRFLCCFVLVAVVIVVVATVVVVVVVVIISIVLLMNFLLFC